MIGPDGRPTNDYFGWRIGTDLKNPAIFLNIENEYYDGNLYTYTINGSTISGEHTIQGLYIHEVGGHIYFAGSMGGSAIGNHDLSFYELLEFISEQTGVSLSVEDVARMSKLGNNCFKSDTPIQMWPLDPSIKPRADGSYDMKLVFSHVWEKPICEIEVGDLVVAYDNEGNIAPKPVTRTMQNQAAHLLDFWNTGVTPGHAYYCADGKFKDRHVPLIDILRTDGAVMRADGSLIRAATNCQVGSLGDRLVNVSATIQKPDGTWTPQQHGKIRFGTRFFTSEGEDTSIMEIATQRGWDITEDGFMTTTVETADGVQEHKFRFPFMFDEAFPKPEDYILTRSNLTLEQIYLAGEWEQIKTQMAAPESLFGLNGNHPDARLRQHVPVANVPPAFERHPDAPRTITGKRSFS